MASFKSERHLLDAIEQCQSNKIIELVKQGHNIHKQNPLGQNFLVHILQQQKSSLSKKRFQIFEFLITNYNLDIHSFDHLGKNIFNWAANLNCTKEALYLLNSNPGDLDILVRDQSGSCSLHYAVEHGNDILVHAIVNYLLRYRLRFDIKDAHNNTPEDLANKLGYDKIGHFLSEACRSTVFMSREIPLTDKFKTPSLSSLLETSEYFNVIETKINVAKNLDDWKTVATLRASKKNANEKNANKTLDSVPQIKTKTSPPKLPLINTPSKFDSQSEQLLRLMELQITPSFRRSFIPVYQQRIDPSIPSQRISNTHNKMSPASSRRVSVLSLRKRDSEASQTSVQDVQNRFSIPPVYKQYRQSNVTTN